jgi:hypothetical protein
MRQEATLSAQGYEKGRGKPTHSTASEREGTFKGVTAKNGRTREREEKTKSSS